MANQKLVNELLAGGILADESGYWQARGYSQFPGWEKLPFADFFENLSSKGGHKKMWLDGEGKFKEGRTSYECDSLLSLYRGMIETQRTVVAVGYFMYSALEVNLHLRLAYYSRKLGCNPDVRAVCEVGDDTIQDDLRDRALALRLAAYIIYERDGLGGYSDKVWQLWGRIKGYPCPDNENILSQEEASEGAQEWSKASDQQRRSLFHKWWCLISEEHAAAHKSIVGHLYTAYKLVQRAQQMESPSPRKPFDPKEIFDLQAALWGFFRRSAVGIGEAKAYGANELNNPANRFADMLSLAYNQVEKLLTGAEGLTPFGRYLLDVHELNTRRNELVDNIVGRQEESEIAQMQMRKEGLHTKVSKRGRARG